VQLKILILQGSVVTDLRRSIYILPSLFYSLLTTAKVKLTRNLGESPTWVRPAP